MESALQAALSSGGPSKAGYRRAHGAAREVLKEESGAALPPRPALDAIEPLPKQRIAALASPILSLIHDMQFYAVMGASTQRNGFRFVNTSTMTVAASFPEVGMKHGFVQCLAFNPVHPLFTVGEGKRLVNYAC